MAAKLSLEGGFWALPRQPRLRQHRLRRRRPLRRHLGVLGHPLEDPPHRGPLGRAAWSGADVVAVSRAARARRAPADEAALADLGRARAGGRRAPLGGGGRDAVRAAGSPLHRATIYRTLDRLVDDGLLVRTNLGAGRQPLRDRRTITITTSSASAAAGSSTSRTTRFGAAIERIEAESGFELAGAHLSLQGRCAGCLLATQP